MGPNERPNANAFDDQLKSFAWFVLEKRAFVSENPSNFFQGRVFFCPDRKLRALVRKPMASKRMETRRKIRMHPVDSKGMRFFGYVPTARTGPGRVDETYSFDLAVLIETLRDHLGAQIDCDIERLRGKEAGMPRLFLRGAHSVHSERAKTTQLANPTTVQHAKTT